MSLVDEQHSRVLMVNNYMLLAAAWRTPIYKRLVMEFKEWFERAVERNHFHLEFGGAIEACLAVGVELPDEVIRLGHLRVRKDKRLPKGQVGEIALAVDLLEPTLVRLRVAAGRGAMPPRGPGDYGEPDAALAPPAPAAGNPVLWSKPDSIKRWALLFGWNRNGFEEKLKEEGIKSKRISWKALIIFLADIPEHVREQMR